MTSLQANTLAKATPKSSSHAACAIILTSMLGMAVLLLKSVVVELLNSLVHFNLAEAELIDLNWPFCSL